MLYSGYCRSVAAEVLLGPDNFVDLLDGPAGTELHYRCHCGRPGVVYARHERAGACAGPPGDAPAGPAPEAAEPAGAPAGAAVVPASGGLSGP